jgi:hypothetical protein
MMVRLQHSDNGGVSRDQGVVKAARSEGKRWGVKETGIMSEANDHSVQRQIRSPRSAAIAGIMYSLLMMTSMILLTGLARATPADVEGDLLERWSGSASLALGMVPFAGIAFLWFTGVIRDRLGEQEDRFFSTIFLGSGIISVVLMFI